jgi:hypothetical protein
LCLAAHSAEARIIYLGSDPGRDQRPFVESFLRSLIEAGVPATIREQVRIITPALDAADEAIRRDVAAALTPQTALIYASTFRMARAVVPLQGRPPLLFSLLHSRLLEHIPALRDAQVANATGVNLFVDTTPKMLELLRLAKPSLRHVCRLQESDRSQYASHAAAAVMALRLEEFAVPDIRAFEALTRSNAFRRCEAFIVDPHPPLTEGARHVARIRALGRLTLYSRGEYVALGAPLAYETDRTDHVRLVGELGARLLAGTPAALLPVIYPRRYQLVFNLDPAAHAVPLPATLLRRVTRWQGVSAAAAKPPQSG